MANGYGAFLGEHVKIYDGPEPQALNPKPSTLNPKGNGGSSLGLPQKDYNKLEYIRHPPNNEGTPFHTLQL